MVVTFLFLIGISGAVCIPAWRFSKRGADQTKWLLFLSTPALLLWIGLTAAGIGAQSLANIIEVLPIAVLGVVAAYPMEALRPGLDIVAYSRMDGPDGPTSVEMRGRLDRRDLERWR